MRTKPLNKPNSMGMIMENFRRYQKVVEAECGPSDNVIYLFESNRRVPTTITVDELREQNNSGKISDEEYVRIWGESFDYEAKEVDRLYEQYLLQEQDEEVEVAGEEEKTVEAPGWLRKLGQLFNKALDFLKDLWKKGIDLVLSGVRKVWGLVKRFKEKHPVMFKVIFWSVVALVALGVLYLVFKWLQSIMDDPTFEADTELPPLCAQAAAAALQEDVGQCLAAGQVLTEDQYKVAMGLLGDLKQDMPEHADTMTQAQDALTQCYESARAGQTINIEDLVDGASMEAHQVAESTAVAQELWAGRGELVTPEYGFMAGQEVPNLPAQGELERANRGLWNEWKEAGTNLDNRIRNIGNTLGIQNLDVRDLSVDWDNLRDPEALNTLRQVIADEGPRSADVIQVVRNLIRIKPHLRSDIMALVGEQ